ncbi:C-type lectin domain-containing protein [Caenorhabditis elegans]|uniref:C-type lectin domain-containing protein n=1 Tax=Caenorhabditis elegans TaxID=6239 RepID=O16642_CAEEL|nr:C-type lectin domain-containing protein [Caenorhabditis elegans]CCD73659.2 C-type lectin domain-containing protein [Caenorhabditis elegans]|eukprot:NP_494566.2 C-type LECtin [Caenorhabditis elegans]
MTLFSPYLSIFFLLTLEFSPIFCMFRPRSSGGNCLDVQAHFYVSEEYDGYTNDVENAYYWRLPGSRNRGNGPCVDLTTYYSVEEDYDGKSDDDGSKYWMVEDLEQTLKLRSDAQEDQKMKLQVEKSSRSSKDQSLDLGDSKTGIALVGVKLQADGSQGSKDQNLVGKIQKDQASQKDQKLNLQANESSRNSKDQSSDSSGSKSGNAKVIMELQADGTYRLKDQKLTAKIQKDQNSDSKTIEDIFNREFEADGLKDQNSKSKDSNTDEASLNVKLQGSQASKDQKASSGAFKSLLSQSSDLTASSSNLTAQLTSTNLGGSGSELSQKLNDLKSNSDSSDQVHLASHQHTRNELSQKTDLSVTTDEKNQKTGFSQNHLINSSLAVSELNNNGKLSGTEVQETVEINQRKDLGNLRDQSSKNLKLEGSEALRSSVDLKKRSLEDQKLSSKDLKTGVAGAQSSSSSDRKDQSSSSTDLNTDASQLELNQNQKRVLIGSDVPLTGEACSKKEQGNCEAGWKSFLRPSGEWCMKIFYENSITQPSAENRCQAQGATLSGLQNQIESFYITYTVSSHIYPESGSIWIGLKRREECKNVGRTQNCTSDNSFEWTDKSTTGLDGIDWDGGQPDNARRYSQQCATLTASHQRSVIGYHVGRLDDVGCEFDYIKTNRKQRDIKAFVCGKKA